MTSCVFTGNRKSYGLNRCGAEPMRYAIWNNKGGVGKSFLTFILSTEVANKRNIPVVLVDMCPQANLSEIILGGNGSGSTHLDKLIKDRKTIGGYFDERIGTPHTPTGTEDAYLIEAHSINNNLPDNIYLIAGDPSLELQAQVINQISTQTLPVESWKNVHSWLADLISACQRKLGKDTTVFVDCSPSFSAYTEVSMIAVDALIVPCSSDGSSARAIDNIGSLLYGVFSGKNYGTANFHQKAQSANINLPKIYSVLLNRSTQYDKKASKAFSAMFDEIKSRVTSLKASVEQYFEKDGPIFSDIPDSHSVAIVCSHFGYPLYSLTTGLYDVHDKQVRVNPDPLNRYKEAVASFIENL